MVAGRVPYHAANEGEGRSERFRRAQGGFCVDDALPFAVVDLIQPAGHGGLETILLDSTVAPDGQRGEGVAAFLDIGVDGLCQGGSLRGCFGPLSGQVLGLDGPGLPDTGGPVCLRNGDTFSAQAQLDEIVAGWQFAGFWDLHGYTSTE